MSRTHHARSALRRSMLVAASTLVCAAVAVPSAAAAPITFTTSVDKVRLVPEGGEILTVTGSNAPYTDQSTVTIGGIPAASVTLVSGTQLTVITPPLPAEARGLVVQVSTPEVDVRPGPAIGVLKAGPDAYTVGHEILQCTSTTSTTTVRPASSTQKVVKFGATLIARSAPLASVTPGEPFSIRELELEFREDAAGTTMPSGALEYNPRALAVTGADVQSLSVPRGTLTLTNGILSPSEGTFDDLATITPLATSSEVTVAVPELRMRRVLADYPDVRSDLVVSCVPAPGEVIARIPVRSIDPPSEVLDYTVTGAATLKSLVSGAIALTGSLGATIAPSGEVSGDLALDPATAKLTALGFLPVQATVAFVSSEPTTGTLTGGVWSSTSKVRIKLPKVTLFGLQLIGGANCQTRSVSSLPLKSTAATFDPATGGRLAGTFAISNLSGCGALTGIVSPLTAGKSNVLMLNLTPKANA